MTISLADVKEKLCAKQYKLTSQRQIVLEVFLDHQNDHLSAEEVHHLLLDQAAEIGLATVYRTLDLLSDLGILQKMDFGDGRNRYELNGDQTLHHHHHLICLKCGKVKEFDDDTLDALEAAIARKSNFRIVDHHLKFYGYCEECQDDSAH